MFAKLGTLTYLFILFSIYGHGLGVSCYIDNCVTEV